MSLPRRLSRELPAHAGQVVRIAGHLEEYRALGGVAFALVRDGSGTTQVTLKKGQTDPSLFSVFQELPRESVVDVEGTVERSEKANRGLELFPTSARIVSRAEIPLPLGVVDKVGAELDTRLNHRVLDLRKPSVRAIFELRSEMLAGFRSAFSRRGFLEVETPKLLRQGAEGGATLFRVDYFDDLAFLAQSPQLYKQMLIGAGFERVFEIAPAFRAEPSDTVRHITEFTSLDVEVGYVETGEELRVLEEEIIAEVFAHLRDSLASTGSPFVDRIPSVKLPLPRISFAEVERWLDRPGTNRDLGAEDEKRVGERAVREFGSELYFLTEFPSAVKEQTFYARRYDDHPELTGYFDLGFSGVEVSSGGPREHRVEKLLNNMRSAGVDPQSFSGYLEAFRFGMPPHAGWGLGIDRLLFALTGVSNIREVRLFPRDRYRLEP